MRLPWSPNGVSPLCAGSAVLHAGMLIGLFASHGICDELRGLLGIALERDAVAYVVIADHRRAVDNDRSRALHTRSVTFNIPAVRHIVEGFERCAARRFKTLSSFLSATGRSIVTSRS